MLATIYMLATMGYNTSDITGKLLWHLPPSAGLKFAYLTDHTHMLATMGFRFTGKLRWHLPPSAGLKFAYLTEHIHMLATMGYNIPDITGKLLWHLPPSADLKFAHLTERIRSTSDLWKDASLLTQSMKPEPLFQHDQRVQLALLAAPDCLFLQIFVLVVALCSFSFTLSHRLLLPLCMSLYTRNDCNVGQRHSPRLLSRSGGLSALRDIAFTTCLDGHSLFL